MSRKERKGKERKGNVVMVKRKRMKKKITIEGRSGVSGYVALLPKKQIRRICTEG
jgi:hypothetical protein